MFKLQIRRYPQTPIVTAVYAKFTRLSREFPRFPFEFAPSGGLDYPVTRALGHAGQTLTVNRSH